MSVFWLRCSKIALVWSIVMMMIADDTIVQNYSQICRWFTADIYMLNQKKILWIDLCYTIDHKIPVWIENRLLYITTDFCFYGRCCCCWCGCCALQLIGHWFMMCKRKVRTIVTNLITRSNTKSLVLISVKFVRAHVVKGNISRHQNKNR